MAGNMAKGNLVSRAFPLKKWVAFFKGKALGTSLGKGPFYLGPSTNKISLPYN